MGNNKFTLLELLVVVAILSILLSILLPSLANVRKKAKSIQCSGNMAQIGRSTALYGDDNNGWAPMTGTDTSFTFTNVHSMSSYLGLAPHEPGADLRVARIALCPTKIWRNSDMGMSSYWTDWWGTSYSYNAHMTYLPWVTSQPDLSNKMMQAKNPSTRMLLGDSYKLAPNSLDVISEFDLRHQNSTNVLFVDIHVEPRSLSEIPVSRSGGNDPMNFYNEK
jgi:prepilin-type N-terminal cleavage/methylation domain-containing protein/prepilin-type processing-associated H-X9-DG protein